ISGKKIDKFEEFGLIKEKSKRVKSPRLKSAIGIMECKLRREERLLKKYSVIIGDIVYAEAEKNIFTNRWHPEKNGPKLLHHLGGKIFSVPANRII
ncbi:MAG: hypothetical protein NT036_06465, partial [Candidatus Omnitrophica bacterium]|nr:hypothetical protein [Candidatus Omnitrophota bacterium]